LIIGGFVVKSALIGFGVDVIRPAGLVFQGLGNNFVSEFFPGGIGLASEIDPYQ
jgi:hypothetical protein